MMLESLGLEKLAVGRSDLLPLCGTANSPFTLMVYVSQCHPCHYTPSPSPDVSSIFTEIPPFHNQIVLGKTTSGESLR